MNIRPATMDDLDGITEIYNEAILTTTATFDTEEKTREEQEEWFAHHTTQGNEEEEGSDGGRHPLIVSVSEGGTVYGWASLSQWSDRCAYSDTAELSLYVKEEYRGKGIGTELMSEIVRTGKRSGIHSVLARVAEGNPVSLKVHERAGFEMIGVMREVGRKFGRLLDVYLFQLIFR